MARGESTSGELPGQDSFLDIVANIVGILILLVMVVGLRAAQQSSSPDEPTEAADEAATASHDAVDEEQLAEVYRVALAAKKEVVGKIAKAVAAREEVEFREAERLELTAFVTSVEQQIEEQRTKMDDAERQAFDVRAELGAAHHELEKLMQERIALAAAESTVEQLESLPTPLSATVSDNEVHLRLAGGHVKAIPWDTLKEAGIERFRAEKWRLESRDVVEVVAGPIDDFRVRMRVRKITVRTPQGMLVQAIGDLFEIMPSREVLGEGVEEALREGSRMSEALAVQGRRRKPTVTVWTYPDSFEEFRQLKAELYQRGYAVAARPLPAGRLIGGSPRGTQSAAQ